MSQIYKEYYDKNVIPFIEEAWAIKWIDGDTGEYGLDYSHYEIFATQGKHEEAPCGREGH